MASSAAVSALELQMDRGAAGAGTAWYLAYAAAQHHPLFPPTRFSPHAGLYAAPIIIGAIFTLISSAVIVCACAAVCARARGLLR